MAFDITKLQLSLQTGAFNLWTYDTTDATGTVDGTDYFAGVSAPALTSKGMNVGDLIYVRIWTTSVPATTAAMNAVNPADAGLYVVRAIDADGNATTAAETALTVAAGT